MKFSTLVISSALVISAFTSLIIFAAEILPTQPQQHSSAQEILSKFSISLPYDWQEIYGLKINRSKVYYDKNSLQIKYVDDNFKFVTGDVLIVFEEPKEIDTGTKSGIIVVKSVLTHFMIECKSGKTAPIYDLLYGMEFPKLSDNIIAVKEYKVEDKIVLTKHNLLYTTLCPEYI